MSVRSEFVRLWNEFMAGAKKISGLPALPSNVQNSDEFEVARAGTSYKATGAQLPSGGASQDLESVLTVGAELTSAHTIESDDNLTVTVEGTLHLGAGPGGIDASSIDFDPAGDVDFSATGTMNISAAEITINGDAGASGEVLTSNGAGSPPTWEAPTGGPNGLAAVDTTGTAISFAVPQIYGTPGAPESGNITLVTTGLVKGMVQVLYHDNGTEPTYPAEFVKLSGTYSTTVLNIIYMHAISTARIEYTISQEQ